MLQNIYAFSQFSTIFGVFNSSCHVWHLPITILCSHGKETMVSNNQLHIFTVSLFQYLLLSPVDIYSTGLPLFPLPLTRQCMRPSDLHACSPIDLHSPVWGCDRVVLSPPQMGAVRLGGHHSVTIEGQRRIKSRDMVGDP